MLDSVRRIDQTEQYRQDALRNEAHPDECHEQREKGVAERGAVPERRREMKQRAAARRRGTIEVARAGVEPARRLRELTEAGLTAAILHAARILPRNKIADEQWQAAEIFFSTAFRSTRPPLEAPISRM